MSILIHLLKDIFLTKNNRQTKFEAASETITVKKVLNVGGNNKAIPIPNYYRGWQHDLLDIDPSVNPDILCDARKLTTLQQGVYDAVYCSHNLEHYYRHEGISVIKGFHHILKDDGFAEIWVPDISQVIAEIQARNLDLDDIMYESAAGPITALDVIYGFQRQIEKSGEDFFAHKTGFTAKSLAKTLLKGGFTHVALRTDNTIESLAIHALAFKHQPTPLLLELFSDMWNVRPNEIVTND